MHSMRLKNTWNLVYFDNFLYPWLINIPSSRARVVMFIQDYTSRIGCEVMFRKFPMVGFYKYNLDEEYNGNCDPNPGAFCIRDYLGMLVYDEERRLDDNSNLVAEVLALEMGLEYCINYNFLPLSLESDS